MNRGCVAWNLAVASGSMLLCSVAQVHAGARPPLFADQAVSRGLTYVISNGPNKYGYLGFGCAFADLDSDGDDDAIILGNDAKTAGIFENDGSGFFTNRSATSGIPSLPQVSGIACADYDGDGDLDINFSQLAAGNVLMRNDGAFMFTPVSAEAGTTDHGAGEAAAWGDYNGDGWLDLFVPNYDGIKPDTAGEPDVLYRNNGDGTFTNVAPALGVNSPGYGFQGLWSDYDRDGDVDLFLSHDRGHLPPLFLGDKLYRNDRGTFTDVSEPSGFGLQLFGMGIAAGDFDNDLDTDYYVTNIGSAFGPLEGANPLLVNDGAGAFTEESETWGVSLKPVPPSTTSGSWWAAIFFDFNHDTWQDLYVASQVNTDRLLMNTGVAPFVDVSVESGVQGGTGNLKATFSAAVSDVDQDGDLDLMVNHMGGNVRLYINQSTNGRHWSKLRIVGEWPNRNAIGAESSIRLGEDWQMREVLAGGNGFLGQNTLIQHYGLDEATVIDEVRVRWPGGLVERTITNLPADQIWSIYPPSQLGDFNGDGMVDLADFSAFQLCFGSGVLPGFEMMDITGDSLIDTDDFADFLVRFRGPTEDCNGNDIVDLQEILLEPALDDNGDGILDDCGSSLAGDLNDDGAVDGADLGLLLGAWNTAGPGDINRDGIVDGADLGLLLASWT